MLDDEDYTYPELKSVLIERFRLKRMQRQIAALRLALILSVAAVALLIRRAAGRGV